MYSIFCCRSARTYSPSLHPVERYEIVRPASSLSTTYLDESAIPASVPEQGLDAAALRDIFATSSSSVRGYNHASQAQPYYYDIFNTEPERPATRRLSSSIVGTLAKNVKKKISGSRLSKRSSKKSLSILENHELVSQDDILGSTSGDTEIDEILGSRNASQGGYDKDAKYIRTPTTVPESTAGSIRISPKYIEKVLRAIEGTSKSDCHSTSLKIGIPLASPNSSRSPIPRTDRHEKFRSQPDFESEDGRPNVKKSPHVLSRTEPQLPDISKEHLRLEDDAATWKSAKRSSLPLPDTMRLPSFSEHRGSWRLSLSDPRRSSSMEPVHGSGSIDAEKRSAAASSQKKGPQRLTVAPHKSTQKHESLMSNLDDFILGPIGSYLSQLPTGPDEESPKGTPGPAETEGALPLPPAPAHLKTLHGRPQSVTCKPSQESRSRSDSDRASVHLFNMRISQRLASSSIMPLSGEHYSGLSSRNSRVMTSSNSLNLLPSVSGSNRDLLRRDSSFADRRVSQGKSQRGSICPKPKLDDTSSFYPSASGSPPRTPVHMHEDDLDQRSVPSIVPTPTQHEQGWEETHGKTLNSRYLGLPELRTAGMLGSSTESLDVDALRSSAPEVGPRHMTVSVPKFSRFTEDFTLRPGKAYPEKSDVVPQSTSLNIVQTTSRSLSDGWLDNERRNRYGYPMTDLSVQEIAAKGEGGLPLEDDNAASIWERALQTVREDGRLGNSKSSFSSSIRPSGWQSNARPSKEYDDTSFIRNGLLAPNSALERQAARLTPDRCLSLSHDQRPRTGSSMEILESLHTREGSRSPMARSISPGFSIFPKKSLDKLRRLTAAGFKLGASSHAPSWTKFPSHTRHERTENATASDRVDVKDFSSLSLSTADNWTPGSPLPTRDKTSNLIKASLKSRSMTFSKLAAKKVVRKWTRLYRSHSSDLRRLRAGHRSSISKGGAVEYPELEIIPGFFGLVDGSSAELGPSGRTWSLGGRPPMEELGDFKAESRRLAKLRAKIDTSSSRLEAQELPADTSQDQIVEASILGVHFSEGLTSLPPCRRSAREWSRMSQRECVEGPAGFFTSPTSPPRQQGSPLINSSTSFVAAPYAASCPDQTPKQHHHSTSVSASEQANESYTDTSVHSLEFPDSGMASYKDSQPKLDSKSLAKAKDLKTGLLRTSNTSNDEFRTKVLEEERKSRRELLQLVGRMGAWSDTSSKVETVVRDRNSAMAGLEIENDLSFRPNTFTRRDRRDSGVASTI